MFKQKEGLQSRQEQRDQRKQEIMMCGLDLIIKKGYQGMKIRDIANELNISTGLFFNYFNSKEDLLDYLIELVFEGPRKGQMVFESGLDPIEAFELVAYEILEAMRNSSLLAKLFVFLMRVSATQDLPIKNIQKVKELNMIQYTVPLIQKGQVLGQIREGDPIALSVAFWSAVEGVAQNAAIHPELPIPESNWIVNILRA